ncbi:4-(cytidine 5'-diphospho)-2-C-methyl-D-erythritol kinase [Chloroflexota bacterium]
MIEINAYAKINLSLEVLGPRPDGYHEVRSVLQTVSLHDTLSFYPANSISTVADLPGWQAKKSLVLRAAEVLKKTTGTHQGARIEVKKRIPLTAGLGGDSANAAATFLGLNRLWQAGLTPEEITAIGSSLGSDIPFFIRGGTALASGRGEVITPLSPTPKRYILLVMPDVPSLPSKTGQLYGLLQKTHFTNGGTTKRLVQAIKEGELPETLLLNTFENLAYHTFEGLELYRRHLLKMGAPNLHLAGSGPALYALFTQEEPAADLLKQCIDQKLKAFMAETVN